MSTRIRTAVYIRHLSGAIHELRGRALANLVRAFRNGAPGPAVTKLVLSGYSGWLSDSGDVLDFEHLSVADLT